MRLWGGQTLTACAGTAEPGVQAMPGAGGLLCPCGRKGLSVEPGEWRVLRTTGGSISSPRPNCWAPGSKWSLSRVAGAWIGLPTLGSSPSLSFGPERGTLPPAPAPWATSTPILGTCLFSGPLTDTPVSWPVAVFPEVEVEKPLPGQLCSMLKQGQRPRVAAGGSLPPASSSVLPHLDAAPLLSLLAFLASSPPALEACLPPPAGACHSHCPASLGQGPLNSCSRVALSPPLPTRRLVLSQ